MHKPQRSETKYLISLIWLQKLFNTKATEVEGKIPGITNQVAKAALNEKATEINSKIPDSTGFITTPEFNRLAKISFDARTKEVAKNLASKVQVDNTLDRADKNVNLRHFDINYFSGKSNFENDGMQNFLVFQPALKYFKTSGTKSHQIIALKFNELSEESIKPPTTLNNSLAPEMTFFDGAKIKVKFDGGCLKQEKITFHHGNIVNVYIVCEIS